MSCRRRFARNVFRTRRLQAIGVVGAGGYPLGEAVPGECPESSATDARVERGEEPKDDMVVVYRFLNDAGERPGMLQREQNSYAKQEGYARDPTLTRDLCRAQGSLSEVDDVYGQGIGFCCARGA